MPARYWCNPDDGHDWTACSSCANYEADWIKKNRAEEKRAREAGR